MKVERVVPAPSWSRIVLFIGRNPDEWGVFECLPADVSNEVFAQMVRDAAQRIAAKIEAGDYVRT